MTQQISLAPVIEVGGRPMADTDYDALLGVRVDRALGVVGRATLRFEDPGFVISTGSTFAIGQTIKISEFPSTELFSGTVVGVTLEQLANDQPHLLVIADDAAYKLNRGSKTVTHLKTTYSGVVRTIVDKAGLKTEISSDSAGSNDYLLQVGSDLAFVDSIAARIGYVWWVDEGTFHFAPAGTSTGKTTVVLEEDLEEFSVRASALRPTAVTISGWSTENQQNMVGQAESGSLLKSPASFVKSYASGAPLGAVPLGSGGLSPGTQAEAKSAAQALFDQSLSAAVVARGTCWVNAGIKPSTTVTIQGTGPAEGDFLVTEVEHIYDVTGFHTRFVAGPVRPAGLVDTLGRPEPDPGFAVQGLVVGVVTNNNDPTNTGRVKVRYAGIPDNIDSNWARVLTTSGGKDRGMVFMPEVDDEVLVGFEGNDARRPVVLGALFSKKNTLPEASKILGQGKVAYRRITSRLGHIIELADGTEAATQHVLIKLGTAEHSLRLGADNFTLEVASGKPVTIKAGSAQFAISAAGDVTVQGGSISIKATKELTLEAPKTTVKATGQMQVQGGEVQVKSMGPGSVEAGGPLSIKGITVAVN